MARTTWQEKAGASVAGGSGIMARLRRFALGEDTSDVIPPVTDLEGRRLAPATAAGTFDPAATAGKTYVKEHPGEMNIELTAVKSSSNAAGYTGLIGQRHYDLMDEMMDKDVTISSSLGLAVGYLMMRPFSLAAPTAELREDPRMEEVIRFCEGALAESNFSYLRWVMTLGVQQHGNAVCEIAWKVRPSDGKIVPERFFHCHPGQFMYSRAGEAFLAGGDGKVTPLPLMKFVRAAGFALYDNPFGQAVLYPLRFAYYFKKKALIAWMRFTDKFGFPLAVGKIPRDAVEAEAIKTAFLSALSRLGTDDALVLGAGEELEFIQRGAGGSSSSSSGSVHQGVVDYLDRAIVRHILGAELTSTVTEKGARSLGEVHERTVLKRVLPFALMVDAAITRAVLRPLVTLNFGPDVPSPLAVTDIEESQTTDESRAILETAAKVNIPVAVEQAQRWLGLRPPLPGEPVLDTKVAGWDGGGGGGAAPEPEPPEPPAKASVRGGAALVPFGDRRAAWAERYSRAGGSDVVAVFREDASFRDDVLQEARDITEESRGVLDRLASAGAESSRAGLATVMKATAAGIARRYGVESESKLPAEAKACVDISGLDASRELSAVVWGGRALALHAKQSFLAPFAASPGEFGARFTAGVRLFSTLPDEFTDAMEWMVSRGVVTVAQANAIAAALAEEFKTKSVDEWAREVRHEYFALAGAVDLGVTKKVQGLIASAVASGQSVAGFLEGVDAATGTAGGLDAYWDMVFRTETGNAYSEQQAAIERDPAFRSVLWGYEGMNPGDERSRESHAKINGVRFALDSAAQVLGYPPFAYQCRCAVVPIMDPDPARSGIRESGGALAVAAGVQRF